MSVFAGDGAVLGAAYGTAPMRAILGEAAALRHMLAFEAALARAEARCGLIPAEAAPAISAAAARIALDPAGLAASVASMGFPTVGLIAQLSAAAGPEAGRYVHWGATTQDVLDTAMVLQWRDALALFAADLDRLIAALVALARAHRETLMPGRTHAQPALPVTLGFKAAVWLDPLLRMRDRLAALRPRCLTLQFGGAVGTLASLGAEGPRVAAALAEELGLGTPDIPWHVSRDRLVEVAAWAAMLAGCCAKPATDILLLMQAEIGEAAEPAAPGKGGSSTMPQKRNPIGCEFVIAQARHAAGLLPQLLLAMPHEQERGAGPMQMEQLAWPPLLLVAHGALASLIPIIAGLEVDAPRMRANLAAQGGTIMAEAAMMALAPALGRGAAHAAVKLAVAAALSGGATLAGALAADAAIAARFDPASIARLTDPASYLGASAIFIDQVLARVDGG
jgi:3-carboxy-cis,cis-muconate cycloisomerase